MNQTTAGTRPLVFEPPSDQPRGAGSLHPGPGGTFASRAAPALVPCDFPALIRLARPDHESLHLAGAALPAALVLALAAELVITQLVNVVASPPVAADLPEPPAAVFTYVG